MPGMATWKERLLIRQFFDPNISKAHRSVIPLEENRPGFVDFIVDFTAGRPVADDVVVDLHSVHDDGDSVADHGRLDGLPFTSRLEVVDGSVAPQAGFAIWAVVAQDLNLMSAPEIKAAV